MKVIQVKKFAIFESDDDGIPSWVSTHDDLEEAEAEQAERLKEGTVGDFGISYIQEVLHFQQVGK